MFVCMPAYYSTAAPGRNGVFPAFEGATRLAAHRLNGKRSSTTVKKVQIGPRNRDKNRDASLLLPFRLSEAGLLAP